VFHKHFHHRKSLILNEQKRQTGIYATSSGSLGYFDSAEHGAGLGGVYVPGSKPTTFAGNATYMVAG
jgi:hypothetical protein